MLPTVLVLTAAFLAGAGAHAQQQAALAPFGWFAELAGACWVGSVDGKPADTQCYEVELDRFIKGTIAVGSFRGAALFAWNAAASRIDYWQWASDGSYRMAEATIDAGRIHFPMPRRDGTAPPERTTWTRVDRDSFRVVRERQDGSAWLPLQTVAYRRQ